MTLDRSFIERNRAATQRIRAMAGLDDEAMQTRVGEHWTVAMMLAHLAFWDQRALIVLEMSARENKLVVTQFDEVLNDLLLPFIAAIPAREAGRLAVEAAQALDDRLAGFSPELLAEVDTFNHRWVDRSLHRNEHINEAQAALGRRGTLSAAV